MDAYNTGMSVKKHSAQIKNRVLSLSLGKSILLIALLFTVTAIIIYSPSLHGPFVLDGKRFIHDSPLTHITKLSQLTDLLFSQEGGYALRNRKICFMSFALNYYFGRLNPFGYLLYNLNPSLI